MTQQKFHINFFSLPMFQKIILIQDIGVCVAENFVPHMFECVCVCVWVFVYVIEREYVCLWNVMECCERCNNWDTEWKKRAKHVCVCVCVFVCVCVCKTERERERNYQVKWMCRQTTAATTTTTTKLFRENPLFCCRCCCLLKINVARTSGSSSFEDCENVEVGPRRGHRKSCSNFIMLLSSNKIQVRIAFGQ